MEVVKSYLRKNLEVLSLYVFFSIAVVGGLLLGFIAHSVENRQMIDKVADYKPSLPTRIYDIKGRLISELFQRQRKLVRFNDIPPQVITAFLAVEDTDFYKHFGVDFPGIMRAMAANIRALDWVQGGSTITQQLVKGVFTEGERALSRKVVEAVLALVVEKQLSKEEILEIYFNQIFLGHGTYGLASAAEFYFGKKVEELTLMDATVLAALPKSPHTYSPFKNFHRAREKNRIILGRLVKLGFLNQGEAELLYENYWNHYWNRIAVTPDSATIYGKKIDRAPHFTEYIRQILVKQFGEDEVYSKGYQVYTTLNLDHQEIAEDLLLKKIEEQDAVARASNNNTSNVDLSLFRLYKELQMIFPLPEITHEYSVEQDFKETFKRSLVDSYDMLTMMLPLEPMNDYSLEFFKVAREFSTNIKVQGAFLSMEPSTGRITAMIGGREFSPSDQYNRAVLARRQPGSAFKPFVYGAALEDRAVHFSSGFLDAPLMDIQPDGSMWAPVNYSGGFRGYVLLNKALAYSLNLISVQLYDLVGPDKIIDFASRMMDIPVSRFQPNPSLALGSSELTPMEMIKGYSVIANQGKDVIPHAIIYITDRDGEIVDEPEHEIQEELSIREREEKIQVIEPGIAFIVRKMLEGVVNNGTANHGVRENGKFRGDAAGKTGTTSSWNDAWFSGFTNELAAVVWMGLDRGSLTLGRHQSGGSLCAPVWGEFMDRVYKLEGERPGKFSDKIPEGVYAAPVCTSMGRLPNEECGEQPVSTSYFPSAIKKDGKVKAVEELPCECGIEETKGFLEILQEDLNISDEEIGKTRGFKRNYGLEE